MPAEITSIDEFVSLSEIALECRVKRSKDVVKLKLRTPSRLYTHKAKVERADDVIRRLKCEIFEVYLPYATGITVINTLSLHDALPSLSLPTARPRPSLR